jgi:hypothetical protein
VDFLGRVTIPVPAPSGLTFPLVSEYPFTIVRDYERIEHHFGELAALATQVYRVGIGPRRFSFAKPVITRTEKKALTAFFDSVQGSFKTFKFTIPKLGPGGSTELADVLFESEPLSIQSLTQSCRTELRFVESIDPSLAPAYDISETVVRFPSALLKTALLEQEQRIIPLISVRVNDPAVPTIYLSDRRVTVSGQLYVPRLLNLGEPGSDIIMSQDISGRADSVSFTFGNGDRAMSALVQDTSLKNADISLSLYHVNTGILIQLWRGIITNWVIDGSPLFRVVCSDGLYPINQQYPKRTASRQCWKPFNRTIYPGFKPCPYTEEGFGGNPISCDYFFNTSNGCVSHGMTHRFGGLPAFPQSVSIKDNGTGTLFGLSRERVTSTSIIAENLWNTPLPEIWCNDDGDPKKSFWANALVAAVRDESDFEDVLGIVGAGPIGAYSGMSVQTNADGFKILVAPIADGFPPQGFKVDSQLRITGYQPTLGLREIRGTDPAIPATDAFSLGQGTPQRWDVPDPTFGSILPLAAGTAFVELRYPKEAGKGLSPTTTAQHSMQVPISRGTIGVTYDPGGTSQTVVEGMVNPFWVAVNTYLRALGIDHAEPDVQLSSFVLSSITNGSTACADIADLQVAPIVGDASVLETQYRFQGMISEPKPYRAWLEEILTCALGFYSFEFGKLRLGIRGHARAESAFTVGNMLYQSLTLVPTEAAFEQLKIAFANRDLQYQEDMAEYIDKDHAEYFGRSGAPLESRQRSVGMSTMSQGLRVCATRVREEIGGVLRPDLANPYTEWDNALTATFKTTILALDTGVGTVISITHPDVPSYPGPVSGSPGASTYLPQPAHTWNYRIQRWTLHKDYSVTISAKSVTDSMYDLTVGPKPEDVLPTPLPALFYPIPAGPAWAPYEVQALATDPLFPSEWTFGIDHNYPDHADGSSGAQLIITGKLPVNRFAPGVGTPTIGRITRSATGGVIPPGTTWRVTVVAYDLAGLPSPPAQIAIVQIPGASGLSWEDTLEEWEDMAMDWGGDTNSFTLSQIIWPNTPGLVSYTVFLSDKDRLICGQQSGSISAVPGGGSSEYVPSSITVPGPFLRSTYALPSPFVAKIRVKAKRLVHAGILGVDVDSIVSANQITSDDLVDDSAVPLNYTGRIVSVIGRRGSLSPYISFRISAFDPATGTITTETDCTGGADAVSILVGDVITIRNLGSDNTADQTAITDPGYRNIRNGYAGMTPSVEYGNILRVISGLGRGQLRKIIGNEADTLYWDTPLLLDSTSVWIVETSDYPYSTDATALANADPLTTTTINIPVDNFIKQPLLIAGFTMDVNGIESPDGDNPIREEWIFGAEGDTGPSVTINGVVVTY